MATVSERPAIRTRDSFRRFAWGVLAWNVLVVLWGAYVRASGSGAGCGSHWPLCNGEALPRAARAQTMIEFTHRLTSGAALIFVIILCCWAFRRFPKSHPARWMAALSVIFLFLEAMLGAGLVLFEYVDRNKSLGRAIYLSAHLVNTQLLLAALTLTAWFARERAGRTGPSAIPGLRSGLLAAILPVALALSVTGAIAALGDTLFPATSLVTGAQQDFSSTAHFLLRLRIIHPALAIASGGFFLFAALSMLRAASPGAARASAACAACLVVIQLCAGVMNLALLAPIWMQLIHLLLANLLWISLVILVWEAGGQKWAQAVSWGERVSPPEPKPQEAANLVNPSCSFKAKPGSGAKQAAARL